MAGPLPPGLRRPGRGKWLGMGRRQVGEPTVDARAATRTTTTTATEAPPVGRSVGGRRRLEEPKEEEEEEEEESSGVCQNQHGTPLACLLPRSWSGLAEKSSFLGYLQSIGQPRFPAGELPRFPPNGQISCHFASSHTIRFRPSVRLQNGRPRPGRI